MHSPLSLKEIKIVFKKCLDHPVTQYWCPVMKIAQKKGFSFKIFEKHRKKQLKQEQENIQS